MCFSQRELLTAKDAGRQSNLWGGGWVSVSVCVLTHTQRRGQELKEQVAYTDAERAAHVRRLINLRCNIHDRTKRY